MNDENLTDASEVLDIAEKAGKFLNNITGGVFGTAGESLNDWASYFRMKNLIKIQDKVDKIIEERKSVGKVTPLPPKLSVVLINSCSLEDSDELQELWAKLIATALEGDNPVLYNTHIEIIKQLSPDEARILEFFSNQNSYNLIMNEKKSYKDMIMTHEYIEEKIPFFDLKVKVWEMCKILDLQYQRVPAYLDNLVRLQLLEFHKNDEVDLVKKDFVTRIGEDSDFELEISHVTTEYLYFTFLGTNFVESCINMDIKTD